MEVIPGFREGETAATPVHRGGLRQCLLAGCRLISFPVLSTEIFGDGAVSDFKQASLVLSKSVPQLLRFHDDVGGMFLLLLHLVGVASV